jgi:hypothetical protein
MISKKQGVFVLGFLLLNCFPLVSQAQGLVGSWSGTVTQPRPKNETYPMKMQLNGTTGSSDYPSLGCGGTLTYLGTQGEGFGYQEHITYGQKKCIDGVIGLVPKGDKLFWEWRGSGYSASATLTEQTAKNILRPMRCKPGE